MSAARTIAGLRLGFLSGRPATIEGSVVRTDAGLGRLIDALQERCPQIKIALSVAPRPMEIHDHRLSIDPAALHLFPPMPSYARAAPKAWACHRVVREFERDLDVSIVQLPFQTPAALLGPRRPRVYHLCADVRAIAEASSYYRGAGRIAALSYAAGIEWVQQRLVHSPQTRLVTNGAELLSRYGLSTGRAVVSSSILEKDIQSIPRRRLPDAPFRALFVGYLRPEKGIETLLEAFERVRKQLPGAELMIVGARPMVDRSSPRVQQIIGALSSENAVQFAGQLPFGPPLFQSFADADVLVLPSLSEGTPRVLVEARAFGCPVIASRIGGIPTSVTDGEDGLLFTPGDARELERAILRLAQDRPLRDKLIAGGIARAHRSTVEAFADQILAEVAQLSTVAAA